VSSKRAGSTFLARLSARNSYHLPRRPNQRQLLQAEIISAGIVTAIAPAARTVIRVFRNPWRIPTIGRRKRNNQGFDTGGQNVLKQNTQSRFNTRTYSAPLVVGRSLRTESVRNWAEHPKIGQSGTPHGISP
jgi:hypothetical protein